MLRVAVISVAASLAAVAGAQSNASPQETALQECIESKAIAHFDRHKSTTPAAVKAVSDACEAKTAAFARSEGLSLDVASKRVAAEAYRQLMFSAEDSYEDDE